MPTIKRTIRKEGQPDKVETFTVPLNSRTVGPGVNNKVIYDLKKRGIASAQVGDASYTWEVQ